jgi:hypothetical protein
VVDRAGRIYVCVIDAHSLAGNFQRANAVA